MIRSVSTPMPLWLLVAALPCLASTPGHTAETPSPGTGSTSYSMVPSSPGDHFVPGKYDKTGSYIPPHYAPVAKPAFHGYFYKRNQPGYDGMNSSTTNKNRLDKTDQAGSTPPN